MTSTHTSDENMSLEDFKAKHAKSDLSDTEKLNNLVESLVEDILHASDEEVLRMAVEECEPLAEEIDCLFDMCIHGYCTGGKERVKELAEKWGYNFRYEERVKVAKKASLDEANRKAGEQFKKGDL